MLYGPAAVFQGSTGAHPGHSGIGGWFCILRSRGGFQLNGVFLVDSTTHRTFTRWSSATWNTQQFVALALTLTSTTHGMLGGSANPFIIICKSSLFLSVLPSRIWGDHLVTVNLLSDTVLSFQPPEDHPRGTDFEVVMWVFINAELYTSHAARFYFPGLRTAAEI